MEQLETLLARPLVADGDLATLCKALAAERPDFPLAQAQLLSGGMNHFLLDAGGEVTRFLRGDYLGMDAQNRKAHACESMWLEALRPRINALPIPQVTHIGQHLAFFSYRKLAGISLTEAAIADLTRQQRQGLGRQVATFLAQLHEVFTQAEAETLHVPTTIWFLAPEDLLQRAWPHLSQDVKPLAEEAAAAYSELAQHDAVLLHGDMFPANMLAAADKPQQLTGIIDFTNMLWQQRVIDFRKLHRLGADGFEACLQTYAELTDKTIQPHTARLIGAVDYLSYIGMFGAQRDCDRQMGLLRALSS